MIDLDELKKQNALDAHAAGESESLNPQLDKDDFNEDLDISDNLNSSLPAFMKKPEVIKMHLDILYKSISFLSQPKIEAMIEKYKQAKEQKRKEEEERIQMQIQMKKSRGRSNANGNPKKDRKMNEEDGADQGEDDLEEFNGPEHKNVLQSAESCQNGGINSNVAQNTLMSKASKSSNVDPLSLKNGLIDAQACGKRGELKSSALTNGQLKSSEMLKSSKLGNNASKQCSKKPGMLSSTKLSKECPTSQNLTSSINGSGVKNAYAFNHKDGGPNESSYSSSSSLNSKYSKESKAGTLITSKLGIKASPKSVCIKRMLRKLRKQRKQAKFIEKIFF